MNIPEDAVPIHLQPKRALTEEEALEELWKAKYNPPLEFNEDGSFKVKDNPLSCNNFVYATLKNEKKMRVWNGRHPIEENEKVHMAPAGTRVLVTMVSRFGDVGIRDYELEPASNGYCARIDPRHLIDWSNRP